MPLTRWSQDFCGLGVGHADGLGVGPNQDPESIGRGKFRGALRCPGRFLHSSNDDRWVSKLDHPFHVKHCPRETRTPLLVFNDHSVVSQQSGAGLDASPRVCFGVPEDATYTSLCNGSAATQTAVARLHPSVFRGGAETRPPQATGSPTTIWPGVSRERRAQNGAHIRGDADRAIFDSGLSIVHVGDRCAIPGLVKLC